MSKGKKRNKGAAKKSEAARNARRDAEGRFRREDPRSTVLAARAKMMGLQNTKENRLGQTAVHLGDDIGRCLDRIAGADAPDLWKVWAGFCAARERYNRRILGQSGTAKGMRLEMMKEHFETDQSHTIDDRTDEERDDDAKRKHAEWNAAVDEIPSLEYRAILHDARANGLECWTPNGPIARGYVIVSAIRELKKVVDG